MRNIFPEVWQEFNDYLPISQQKDLMSAYYKLVMDPNFEIALGAARAFIKYDFTCAFLKISAKQLNNRLADDKLVLGCARTFMHYAVNNFFLKENQFPF